MFLWSIDGYSTEPNLLNTYTIISIRKCFPNSIELTCKNTQLLQILLVSKHRKKKNKGEG